MSHVHVPTPCSTPAWFISAHLGESQPCRFTLHCHLACLLARHAMFRHTIQSRMPVWHRHTVKQRVLMHYPGNFHRSCFSGLCDCKPQAPCRRFAAGWHQGVCMYTCTHMCGFWFDRWRVCVWHATLFLLKCGILERNTQV